MQAKELQAKDEAALTKELQELLRAGFSLRMQKATQQLRDTSQIRKTRRDVARVRTVLSQKGNAK